MMLYECAIRNMLIPQLSEFIDKQKAEFLGNINKEKGLQSVLNELKNNHQDLVNGFCMKYNLAYSELITSLKLYSEGDNNVFRLKIENILAQKQVHYISLILGDITMIPADVIVNSANKSLLAGSGVCGAIHRVAGPKLEQECQELRKKLNIKFIKIGNHIVTKAYGLPAKWVIHTVGPKQNENIKHENISLLGWCYIRSIVNADDMGAKSISFPAISTGIHNISIDESAKIVKSALLHELPKLLPITNVTEIKLVFNNSQDFSVYQKVFTEKDVILE